MSLSRLRREDETPRVEINIVPLVDVSLVLLIIFLVTATFVKSGGLRVELPAGAAPAPATATREVVVEIGADGAFAWNGAGVTDAALASALRDEARSHGTQTRVTIRGDRRAAYGQVVRAMSFARDAGFTHLLAATTPTRNEVRFSAP